LPDVPPVAAPGKPRTHQKPQEPDQPQGALAAAQQFYRRTMRTLRLILSIALVVLLIAGGLFYLQVREVAQSIVVREVRANPPLATPLIGGINVLLIGVDERPDNPEEGIRSDTLILTRLNPGGGWANLLTIPRDTQVELPELGITKINVAYGYGYEHAEALYGSGTTPQQGGMALAAEAVETFLGLSERGMRVDYTAQVNFEGFASVIDTLGGITIDVPYFIEDHAYPTEDLRTMYVSFEAGPQRMDGATALIYARTRHYDSDFSRNQRQQQVLHAIVGEFRQRSYPERLWLMPRILKSITGAEGTTPPVITTMPIDRLDIMPGMVLLASRLHPERIGQFGINPDEVVLTAEVGSNLIWDPDSVHEQVSRFLKRSP
jgi:LCP family protein required for cell wall assembly